MTELETTSFSYELTEHCQIRIDEREIPLDWIAKVLFSPQKTEAHPTDPTAICVYATIPEAGDLVLKVVYNATTTPCRVITVHFDRRAKRKL